MAKTKIFTPANMLKYGFTDQEITQLNAEWEQKAARLRLEEHLPEYWQEAKQHMSEIISGRNVEQIEMAEIHAGDTGQVELPSLDIDLNEFSLLKEADNVEQDEIILEELPDIEDIFDEEITFEETPEEVPAEPEIIEIEKPPAPAEEAVQEEIPETPLELEKDVSPVEEEVQKETLEKEQEAREETAAPVEAKISPVEREILEEPSAAEDETVEKTEEPVTIEKESFFTKILKILRIK